MRSVASVISLLATLSFWKLIKRISHDSAVSSSFVTTITNLQACSSILPLSSIKSKNASGFDMYWRRVFSALMANRNIPSGSWLCDASISVCPALFKSLFLASLCLWGQFKNRYNSGASGIASCNLWRSSDSFIGSCWNRKAIVLRWQKHWKGRGLASLF